MSSTTTTPRRSGRPSRAPSSLGSLAGASTTGSGPSGHFNQSTAIDMDESAAAPPGGSTPASSFGAHSGPPVAVPTAVRPRFPDEWAYFDLPPTELNLDNTLPVGQAFLWHRRAVPGPSRSGSPAKASQEGTVPKEMGLEVDIKPDPSPIKASGLSDSNGASSTAVDDITVEYSRAVHDPPRVVLMRQSRAKRRIYYAAVYPPRSTCTDHHGASPSTHSPLAKNENGVDVCTSWEVDRAQGVTERWARGYFQLDNRLGEMYAEWAGRDPDLFGREVRVPVAMAMAEKKEASSGFDGSEASEWEASWGGRGEGIRVLRQDPWECLIAFITSTNNHITRIASLMHKLCVHFSPPLLSLKPPSTTSSVTVSSALIDGEDVKPTIPPTNEVNAVPPNTEPPSDIMYHLFPPAHSLPSTLEATLRELGFGYRAGFIESSLGTLRTAFGTGTGDIERGLEMLRGGDVESVRETLCGLKGVGRKVADCVMLMSLDQPHLIPIDTHLSAIAGRHPRFPSRLRNKPMSKIVYDEVQTFLEGLWGGMGGWAQAVMFAVDLPEGREGVGAIKLEGSRTPKKGAGTGTGTPRTPRTPGTPATPGTSRGGKRKVGKETRVDAAGDGFPFGDVGGAGSVPSTPGTPSKGVGNGDMPAGYGFKRTRSAARIELGRQNSGVSALAEDVKDLDV